MEYVTTTYFPKGSKDVIMFQYRTVKGDLYLVTQRKFSWILYKNNNKIKESEDYKDIAKLIPEGK